MGKEETSADGGGSSNYTLGLLLIVFGGGVLLKLLWPWIIRTWHFWLAYHRQIVLCAWALVVAIAGICIALLWNSYMRRRSVEAVTEKDATSVFLGVESGTKKELHLKEAFRPSHMQVIGTTDAGKTTSVVMPCTAQDIEQGRGLMILDGKAERGFLNQIYSHVVANSRQSDFMVFSLANPYISSTYNPFCEGTAEQIAERAFSTFNIIDPYYGPLQFAALRTMIALLMRRGERPMPGVIRELLRNKEKLKSWLPGLEDKNLAADVQAILDDKDEDFQKKYSGLVTALGHFSQGSTARLFNTRSPEIDLMDAIKRRKIIYFQLPTMQYQFLASTTGKLILQSLQSVVSQIHVEGKRPDQLFSVYLDDFNDYLYPGFASLLNKSRSANVGVVFAHQSLGDLEKIGPEFKQIVVTNTNIKVFMRSNDPDSAEHFSKIIGTRTTEKTTERRMRSFFRSKDTGDQSVREAEEYIIHPNTFKADQGRGEGVMVIPHPKGRVVKHIDFTPMRDLPLIQLPIRDLPEPDLSLEATCRGVVIPKVKEVPQGATQAPQATPEVKK